MYKYKYTLTMLAMLCFNFAILNLQQQSDLTSVCFFLIGFFLLAAKSNLIVKNSNGREDLREQALQWLFEISLFVGYAGYNIGTHSPLFCAVLVVIGVILLLAFLGIVLNIEMSKLE